MEEEIYMIICVALNEDREIAYSLERTEIAKIYETSGDMITNNYEKDMSTLDLDEKAQELKDMDVKVLFIETLDDEETASFGPYALQVYVNATGAPDDLVLAYLDGEYEEVLQEAKNKQEGYMYDYQKTRDREIAYEAGMIEPDSDCECEDSCECTSEDNCGCMDNTEEEK